MPTTVSKAWEALPDLPQARSSHDAIVLDGKLYVLGGWELTGDSEGEWHDNILVMDLGAKTPAWQIIDKTPFRKRALSAAAYNGELYALCGMNEDADIDRTVFVFDPTIQKWREGPELDGDGMDGFGVSAWGTRDGLFMSGHDGVLQRLDVDENRWTASGKLKTGRFFHRLLPYNEGRLIAVAGASMTGHLSDVEVLVPEPMQRVANAAK